MANLTQMSEEKAAQLMESNKFLRKMNFIKQILFFWDYK